MSSRYVDDRDYRSSESRRRERDRDPRERVDTTRDTRRRVEERPDPRRDTQMSDAMDVTMDRRVDHRMDSRRDVDPRGVNRMDMGMGRDTARANTASRMEPLRPERIDSRSTEPDEKYVRDPATGQLYRQVPASRTAAYARGGPDRDYVEGPPASRSRTQIDAEMRGSRDEPKSAGTEYWCSGDGIEREVLQHEICKFLGQDATSRPGTDERGRPGFWIRAYRPFTTAMENTLREETTRWSREKERRRRHREPQGSYEQMAEQERRRAHPPIDDDRRRPLPPVDDDDMDMDDYPIRAQPTRRHDLRDVHNMRDVRDMEPRPVATGRIPVSTGYPPEPGYPAQYAISSQQPGYPSGQSAYYGSEREPRAFAGNTTPPNSSISRAQPGGYGQPGYPPQGYTSSRQSAPPVSQSIPAAYDPRARDMMSGAYPSGYLDGRSRR